MGCIRMTDIVGKSLTGIVGTSVKPFTKKFFNNFIYNKKLGQYEYIFKNNKNLSESVIENVITTIVCTFDKNSKETIEKLLSTTDNHQEFIDYLLLNAQCYESSFDKHSEECSMFNKIIECLVEDMYQLEILKNLIMCFSETEREILLFNGQNNILKQLGDSNRQISKQISEIKNLIEAYNSINQGLTLSKENKIVDDNEEFIGQYKDSLFLEANINDDDYMILDGLDEVKEAHLSGADLSGAHLLGTDLSGADLVGADLVGADLSGTDLEGADLSGANLNKVNMNGVYLNGTNYLDRFFSKRAYYKGASFNSVILNETELNNILLYEQDLLKFDEYIKKYNVKLIDPKIICVSEHEGYVYDSKTNRMIPPGDKIESKDKG